MKLRYPFCLRMRLSSLPYQSSIVLFEMQSPGKTWFKSYCKSVQTPLPSFYHEQRPTA